VRTHIRHVAQVFVRLGADARISRQRALEQRRLLRLDTRTAGVQDRGCYDEPIGELIALVEAHPADVDGSFQARVVSVEQVGDAAFAVLEEQGFWGTVSMTDFFTLAHIDGKWTIVNKTFAHTGGEPPAMYPAGAHDACLNSPRRRTSQ
jgi:hypothetical protein